MGVTAAATCPCELPPSIPMYHSATHASSLLRPLPSLDVEKMTDSATALATPAPSRPLASSHERPIRKRLDTTRRALATQPDSQPPDARDSARDRARCPGPFLSSKYPHSPNARASFLASSPSQLASLWTVIEAAASASQTTSRSQSFPTTP